MPLIAFDFVSAPSLEDPNLLRKAFELRQKQFNTALRYNMPTWQNMEFDAYDNLSAAYIVRTGDNGSVLGFTRIVPTKFKNYDHSMIKDLWSRIVDGEIPSDEVIYEGSRFVVAPELAANPSLRSRVIDEMVLGIMEFCLRAKAKQIIGVMYPKVWGSVFEKRGWNVTILGGPVNVGTSDEHAEIVTVGIKEVNVTQYRQIQETVGIRKPVLEFAPTMIIGNQNERSLWKRNVSKDMIAPK